MKISKFRHIAPSTIRLPKKYQYLISSRIYAFILHTFSAKFVRNCLSNNIDFKRPGQEQEERRKRKLENDDARDKTYNPDSESESEPEVVVCKSIGKRPIKNPRVCIIK